MRADKGDDGEAGNNEQQCRRLAQRLHRNGEVSKLDFMIRENAIAAAVNSAVVSKIEGCSFAELGGARIHGSAGDVSRKADQVGDRDDGQRNADAESPTFHRDANKQKCRFCCEGEMVPSFARLDRLTMVCIQAVQETATTQLLHSMRALNQPYSRHSRRVCSPSIRRQRANMMPLAKALKLYAATCAAIIQCNESAVNVRGFHSAMQRHSTVTPQLPNAVSSCICRGRRRALLHTSDQKTRYQSGRCSIHLIGLLSSLSACSA